MLRNLPLDELSVLEVECMIKTGTGRYREARFFINWLKTSSWSSDVVSGLQQLVEGNRFYGDNSAILEIQMYQRLLKMCQEDALADILVPEENLKEIIKLLGILLEQLFKKEMKSKRIDLALYFIHDVFISILKNPEICWKLESVENFVYQLFCASLHDTVDLKNQDDVSQILFEILDAFVSSYLQAKHQIMNEESIIFKIGKELNSSIHSLESQEEALCVEKHCLFFLTSVEKYMSIHKPHLHSTFFISYKLMDVILPSTDSWNSLKSKLTINIAPLYLKKKIFYPLATEEKMFYPEDIVLKFNLAANVVSSILCDESIMSKDGEENTKFLMHYINEHFAHLLWCLTFNNGIKTTTIADGNSLVEQLQEKCLKMLSVLSNCAIEQLKQKLFDMSLLDENWALCLMTLCEIFPSCNLKNIADKKFDKVSKEWPGLHKYVVRQVLIHHLSMEEKKSHLKELVTDLMKMKDLTDFNVPGKMGELCCYLQDKSMMVFLDVQNCLKTLFERIIQFDFTDCDRLEYTYRLQMIHVLSCEIQYGFCIISPTIWDYFIELLQNTLPKCHAKTNYDKPKSALLLYQVIVIFISLSELLKMIQVNQPDIDPNWNPEPISDKTYASMLNLFGAVSEYFNFAKSLPEVTEMVLSKFLEALEFIPMDNLLIKCQDMKTQYVLNFYPRKFIPRSLLLMKSPVRQVQFAVHILFLKMMPVIPKIASERDISKERREDETEEEEEEITIPKIGWCLMQSETLKGNSFSASPSQIRLGYATHLEELGLLSPMFSNVFRFMPENPILCLKKGLKLESPKKEDLKLLFIKPPQLNSVPPSSEEIQSIACYVFATALRTVPASIRQWWNNLDRKSADIVNAFTSKYVSGLLCTAEIQAVHENEKQFENLMVQARPGSREVIATYTIDDCAIELCVQLPTNYPLGPISAERRGKVVIGQQEWRHWLMQLTTVLTYQHNRLSQEWVVFETGSIIKITREN
ncbi:E3 ubiquitin-protein ligase listerin like protein [Argiope bruennichi]|uniref:E3 ubiquitin-protein ligase listerin n=1 Tax=Argiope bruennichi TaxID=94029 RepID=A0A8T0FE97_ARGBR|nr:E3 ubiquitin-protein ligase listerin like protein [Argiope bruennichi]